MATRIDAEIAGADSNCYLSLADADAHFAEGIREEAWEKLPDSDRERALIAATRQIERLRLRGSKSDPSTPQALHFPRAGDYEHVDEANINDIYDRAGDTLDLVSTSASDTQVATIVGHDSDGLRISEDVTLEGATPVTSTETFQRLRSITLASAAVGTVTISETNGGDDLCTIDIGDTEPDTTYELVIVQDVQDACCEQALYLLQVEAGGGEDLVDHQALQAMGVRSFSADGYSVSYGAQSARGWSPIAWGLIQPYRMATGKIMPRGEGQKGYTPVFRGDPDA